MKKFSHFIPIYDDAVFAHYGPAKFLRDFSAPFTSWPLCFFSTFVFSLPFKEFPLFPGVMPHVPRMLPVLVSDPEARLRAQETFESEDFKNNIEKYFVENIKVSP